MGGRWDARTDMLEFMVAVQVRRVGWISLALIPLAASGKQKVKRRNDEVAKKSLLKTNS